jgi:hypothetical protein
MRIASLVACFALSVVGCEKDSGPKGSGPLAAADTSLLKDIPGGNVAVFGGNYMKLQNFMQSQTAKMAMDMADKYGGGGETMKKWMACFVEFKDLKLVGGVQLKAGSAFDLRMAFTGMKVADLDGCAKKAGMESTVDPDGKFIAIQIPAMGQTVAQGYLQLKDGALYSRQSMAMGLVPKFETVSRADLEADAAGGKTAADDSKLVALAEKADRTQTIWFAGTGEGTPLSAKLGDVFGSFNIENGMQADVTVKLLDSKDASQIEDGLAQAKKMADQLPPNMKGVIDGIKIKRDGGQLRFMMKLSESDLASLMKMGGGGMGGF